MFDHIARRILNRRILKVSSFTFRILEIEFYYYSCDHPDPYVHCHSEQLSNSAFYFHPKGGSFKGLDITFGDEKTYGGILIRSIQNLETFQIVEGPSLVVNHLISILPNVKEYHSQHVEEDSNFCLIKSRSVERTIFITPRVGLKPKENDYWKRDYRFLTEPRLLKKGRSQTIQGLSKNYSIEEIIELTGSPRRTVEKYFLLNQ